MFEKYTQELWEFANNTEPFSCKDIEITLSELAEEKNLTKNLTEKFQNKVDELSAVKLNRSQLETELEREKKKVTNLKEINKNRTSELANSIKKLNEIKNKSSEAETIKMLEEVIQGLNLTAVIKVIRVVEFSSWAYKI